MEGTGCSGHVGIAVYVTDIMPACRSFGEVTGTSPPDYAAPFERQSLFWRSPVKWANAEEVVFGPAQGSHTKSRRGVFSSKTFGIVNVSLNLL